MYTRRFLLLSPFYAAAAAHAASHVNLHVEHDDAPKTPRNELAWANNDFDHQHADWAKKMNATGPGTLPAAAVEAFEPLGEMWRQVEKKFRTWLRGY